MSFQVGDRVEMDPTYRDWGRSEAQPRKVGTVVGGLPESERGRDHAELYTRHVFDAREGVPAFATVWVEWDDPAYGSSSCSPGLLERLPMDFGSAELAR